jgi:hypothetical protein
MKLLSGGPLRCGDAAVSFELGQQSFGSPGHADAAGGVGDLLAIAGDAGMLPALR